MTMHPELKYAFDTGASMREVIDIFAKYHHGPEQEYINYFYILNSRHNSPRFWDDWHPLFRNLASSFPVGKRWSDIIEPSLNIHRALTRDIISWLCDTRRESNIYLISELWVPDTEDNLETYSRAAVIGRICSRSRRFGNLMHEEYRYAEWKITQLSAQLAAAYPPYRRILSQILVDYPGIRRLPQRALFKKLIYDPWKVVQHCYPGFITAPPVVVLRYCEPWPEGLFHTILEFGSPPHSSPLLWIISADPEYKLPIQDLVGPFTPRYTRPPVCYDEVLGDAELVLRHQFGALRRRYNRTFDNNVVWPSNEQITQMARVVLGLFQFIDVIIQFIDREEDGGPRAHLETFLGYMVDAPLPSDERQYCALDHFYIRALSSIPPDVFLGVKKLFSMARWGSELHIKAELPILVLRRVDTFAFVPYIFRTRFRNDPSPFYSCRGYFRRFIEDPNRSGQFFTPQSESCLQAYQACLQFISRLPDFRITLKALVSQMSRNDLKTSVGSFEQLRRGALLDLCKMPIMRVNKVLLRRFDFRCLAHICDNIALYDFASLINVLYEDEGDNSSGIVRVEPISLLDRKFIDKCQGFAVPYNFKSEGTPTRPKYVLLGYGDQTVLAVMASREQHEDTMQGVGMGKYGGVTIYTSAMLDYM